MLKAAGRQKPCGGPQLFRSLCKGVTVSFVVRYGYESIVSSGDYGAWALEDLTVSGARVEPQVPLPFGQVGRVKRPALGSKADLVKKGFVVVELIPRTSIDLEI